MLGIDHENKVDPWKFVLCWLNETFCVLGISFTVHDGDIKAYMCMQIISFNQVLFLELNNFQKYDRSITSGNKNID